MCNPGQGASTDSLGQFRIEHVAPGIYQLSVSCIGYKNLLSPYTASAWDNRFIANVSGTYDFPRNWSVGTLLPTIGLTVEF